MNKQRCIVYMEYVFDGVFDVIAERRRKHGRKFCKIVGWLWGKHSQYLIR
jgi:hypothetical protein